MSGGRITELPVSGADCRVPPVTTFTQQSPATSEQDSGRGSCELYIQTHHSGPCPALQTLRTRSVKYVKNDGGSCSLPPTSGGGRGCSPGCDDVILTVLAKLSPDILSSCVKHSCYLRTTNCLNHTHARPNQARKLVSQHHYCHSQSGAHLSLSHNHRHYVWSLSVTIRTIMITSQSLTSGYLHATDR